MHKRVDRNAAKLRAYVDLRRDAVLSVDDAARFGSAPVNTVEVGIDSLRGDTVL